MHDRREIRPCVFPIEHRIKNNRIAEEPIAHRQCDAAVQSLADLLHGELDVGSHFDECDHHACILAHGQSRRIGNGKIFPNHSKDLQRSLVTILLSIIRPQRLCCGHRFPIHPIQPGHE
jgi:hypothetical protein